jgi:hypothetical protein
MLDESFYRNVNEGNNLCLFIENEGNNNLFQTNTW